MKYNVRSIYTVQKRSTSELSIDCIPITVRLKESEANPTLFLDTHSHRPASTFPISLISITPVTEFTLNRLPFVTYVNNIVLFITQGVHVA